MVRIDPLNKKLFREMLRLRGQLIATALVVACGVASYVSMRSTYESLRVTQEEYYSRYRFGDVFARVKRAPENVRREIERIPGVASVETRVVADVNLNVVGLPEPASGRIASIPDQQRSMLNDMYLSSGRYISRHASDEVMISSAFANANNFHHGDTIEAVLNGHWRKLKIVGIALSPEYIYEIRSGDIFPDNRRFGIIWMGRESLAAAFDMTGAFNDVSLALAPGASEQTVIDELDRLLTEYGGTGAFGRDDQQSYRFISNEFSQLEVQGVFLPAIFLGVTAFLVHIVMSRLVKTQREQIGLLKAFGYSNVDVGLHYLKLAFAAVGVGTVIGVAFGAWLGSAMTDLYTEYFHFPILEFRISGFVFATTLMITLGTAAVGSIYAVMNAVSLPPAEAMRPEMPPRFRAGFIERIGLQGYMSPAHRIIIRSLSRHPFKAVMGTVGIAMAAALLFTGFYFFDAVSRIVELQFHEAIRNDIDVVFYQPRSHLAVNELRSLPGVTSVEPYRVVPARVRFGHRTKRIAITGLAENAELRRIVDVESNVVRPPVDGLMLSRSLADLLEADVEDILQIEVLEGGRPTLQLPVSSIVDDLMGLNAYMEIRALNRIVHEDDLVSGAYVKADTSQLEKLYTELKQKPSIAGVGLPGVMLNSFNETFGRTIGTFTFFLVSFASVIVFGVVYNGARIALSERGHELASLRVLGFTKREIASILLGEQAIVTAASIPLGFVFGYYTSLLSNNLVDTEMLRLPMVFSARTFIVTGTITALAAVVSGLLVGWRINKLDLVGVLKTRE